jgi:hypothetical protein
MLRTCNSYRAQRRYFALTQSCHRTNVIFRTATLTSDEPPNLFLDTDTLPQASNPAQQFALSSSCHFLRLNYLHVGGGTTIPANQDISVD